jgi:hypothetical protein
VFDILLPLQRVLDSRLGVVLCVGSFAEFLDLLEIAVGGISSKFTPNATHGPKNGSNPKIGFYLLCVLLSLTT